MEKSIISDIHGVLLDHTGRAGVAVEEFMGVAIEDPRKIYDLIARLEKKDRRELFRIMDTPEKYELDEPMPGVAEHMERLGRSFKLIYITSMFGKDPKIKQVLLRNLKRGGFPLPDDESVLLIMNHDRDIGTRAYKKQAIERVKREKMNPRAGIGDEPRDSEIYLECGLDSYIYFSGRYRKKDFPDRTIFFKYWKGLVERMERIY